MGDVDRYVTLVPIGAGAVLVALLANGRIATVHAVFVAVLFGAASGWDHPLALWALLTQWAGVYAVTSYRERSTLLRAGLVVGSAGAAAYLLGPDARNVTGTTLYVDSGYHAMGM